jgi:hypothetical protein
MKYWNSNRTMWTPNCFVSMQLFGWCIYWRSLCYVSTFKWVFSTGVVLEAERDFSRHLVKHKITNKWNIEIAIEQCELPTKCDSHTRCLEKSLSASSTTPVENTHLKVILSRPRRSPNILVLQSKSNILIQMTSASYFTGNTSCMFL